MSTDEKYYDSTNLIMFIYRNFKVLLITSILAAIVSAVISLMIEDKYKSVVTLYPSNTSSISKALLHQSAGVKNDILEFGEEEKTEQLLQILSSDQVRTKIFERFPLMEHYEIDPDSKTKNTDLAEAYDANFEFRRNEFMAVEIIVLDKDPEMAANLANSTADILDEVMNDIQKARAIPGFKIVEKSYFEYLNYVQGLEDSLNFIMGKGVHDVEAQSEVLTKAYADAIASNNTRAYDAIKKQMEVLSKYGAKQYNLKEKIQNTAVQLSKLKEKYEEAKVDAEEKITNYFKVNSASVAEKKSYPIRWLIVATATLSMFLFTILILIISEQIKKFK